MELQVFSMVTKSMNGIENELLFHWILTWKREVVDKLFQVEMS